MTSANKSLLNGLDSTDICKIIRQCQKSGIKRLDLGNGFKVELGDVAEIDNSLVEEEVIEDTYDNNESEAAEEIDDAMAELMILDPEAYEELQTTGEINNA